MTSTDSPEHAASVSSLIPIVVIAAIALWLGGVATVLNSARLDAGDSGKVAVLFWPPPGPEASLRAIISAGGEPVRPIAGSALWIAHSAEPGFVGRLRLQGARAAFSEIEFGPAFAGCFAFLPAKPRKPTIQP